jgi:hypothetical protein
LCRYSSVTKLLSRYEFDPFESDITDVDAVFDVFRFASPSTTTATATLSIGTVTQQNAFQHNHRIDNMKISLLVVSMVAAGGEAFIAPAFNRASVVPQMAVRRSSNSRIFANSSEEENVVDGGDLDLASSTKKVFDPIPAAMAAFITLSSSPAFADSPDWGKHSRDSTREWYMFVENGRILVSHAIFFKSIHRPL